MTKADLVEKVILRSGIARASAIEAVDSVIKILSKTIVAGENIYLRGLGTFRIRKSCKRIARDISRGKTIVIPERRKVKFIPGSIIKNSLK